MVDEPSEDGSQVMLAEWDEVPEALVLGRANEPVGVGVEVPGWVVGQAQPLHPSLLQNAPKLRRVEGVAVDD